MLRAPLTAWLPDDAFYGKAKAVQEAAKKAYKRAAEVELAWPPPAPDTCATVTHHAQQQPAPQLSSSRPQLACQGRRPKTGSPPCRDWGRLRPPQLQQAPPRHCGEGRPPSPPDTTSPLPGLPTSPPPGLSWQSGPRATVPPLPAHRLAPTPHIPSLSPMHVENGSRSCWHNTAEVESHSWPATRISSGCPGVRPAAQTMGVALKARWPQMPYQT